MKNKHLFLCVAWILAAFSAESYGQVGPEWLTEPANYSMACNPDPTQQKFSIWLNSPMVYGAGSILKAANDFNSLVVHSPAEISGPYAVGIATGFGPQVFSVTGQVELATDGTNHLACNPIFGFTPGRIALIDRGICTFSAKALQAETAGAIGVIICNNVEGDPVDMGGTTWEIGIPVLMISKLDGDRLKANLATGVQVTLSRKSFDQTCVSLPRSVEVLFTGLDEYRNSLTKTATFTLAENVSPVWNVSPVDLALACNPATNNADILAWLLRFSATGTCGNTIVTNDYSSLSIAAPIAISRGFQNSWAEFGPRHFARSGYLELATDGVNNKCCNPLVGFTPGRIAVIDRGACNFTNKVRHAQEAGAIGVIICNIVPGLMVMGDDGTGSDIGIPVLMVSYDDGVLLKSQMEIQMVRGTMSKRYPDSFCSPQKVIFTAIDECGNSVVQNAFFSVAADPPVWVHPPEKISVVCNEETNLTNFLQWLRSPVAATNCGNVVVSNDFCSLIIREPVEYARPVVSTTTRFGPQECYLTGDLELAHDIAFDTECCQALSDFTAGHIALIDAGGCAYTQKVLNAQNAGAIGVVICYETDDLLLLPSGIEPAITIPSLVIGMTDGNHLKDLLTKGIVNVTIYKRDFNLTCSALPKSLYINFGATPECGTEIMATSRFELIQNNPPAWDLAPVPKTMACKGTNDNFSVFEWLNNFGATGPCGPAKVTNNFSILRVNTPVEIAGPMVNSWALFGAHHWVQGEVEMVYDQTDATSDGCEPPVGFTPGKIALIDRGTCTFVTKARNAQNAGAIAVIICSNTTDPPLLMGDDLTGSDITIPIMMISQADGILLKARLSEGKVVEVGMGANYLSEDCVSSFEAPVWFTATDPCGNYIKEMVYLSRYSLFTFEITADVAERPEPGGAVTWTMKLKNISSSNLDINVDTSNGPNFSFFMIAPGEEKVFSYNYAITEPGTYTVWAEATTTAPNGDEISLRAYAHTTVTDVKPQIEIVKVVSPDHICSPGGIADWAITVKNIGPEQVDGVVSDLFSPILPQHIILDPGDVITFAYGSSFTSSEYDVLHNNTATAVVSDNDGNTAEFSSTATVVVHTVPLVFGANLQASAATAGPPWDIPVDGDLASGYTLCLDPEVEFYYLDINELQINTILKQDARNAFWLKSVSDPVAFNHYWDLKGVNAAAVPGTWEAYMYHIITGFQPMFFMVNDGPDIKLIDGFMALFAGDYSQILKLNGDYPPLTYTFEGHVINTGDCLSEDFEIKITLKQIAKIIIQPVSQVTCSGESATLSVEAEGTNLNYLWYKNDVPIGGSNSPILVIDNATPADAADYYVIVTGDCNEVKSDVVKLAVKEVLVTPDPQQYSDPVTFTAIIHNGVTMADQFRQVTFRVESQVMGTVPLVSTGLNLIGILKNVPLLEPDPGNGVMSPGIKTVRAGFKDATGTIIGCVVETTLEIIPENARLSYDGVELQATASVNETSAIVQLIAVIKDWEDGWPGDIRNACITFRIFDAGDNLVHHVTLPVNRLIIPGDISTGIVSYDWLVNLGAADFKTFTIKVIADCYYAARRSATLTVYKPVGDFITGGGHINTVQSFGTRAGEPDTPINFGFHVKFNKKNTNLIGGMNMIYRRMVGEELIEFQIKSNAMNTLGVNVFDPNAKTSVFTTKANLTNLTTGASVEGNLMLYVTLTDRGNPGDQDAIGLTLWRLNNKGKPSILVYSSSWNGVKTIERYLEGGNLVVHSGFSLKEGLITEPFPLDLVSNEAETTLEVYPNPTFGPVTFRFTVGESAMTTIDIYSSTGQIVSRAWEGYIKAGEEKSVYYDGKLAKGLYFIQLRNGGQLRTTRLVMSSTF